MGYATYFYFFITVQIVCGQQVTITPDPTDPHVQPDTNAYNGGFRASSQLVNCTAPVVVSKSVVQYVNGVSAYIQIRGWNAQYGSLILSNSQNPSSISPVNLTGDIAILNNLMPEQVYLLKCNNSCREQITLAVINTYSFKPGEDYIYTSDALYKALSAYVATEGTRLPLDVYVQQISTVNQYEKIEFAQKYFLRGGKIPNSMIGKFPDALITDVKNSPDVRENPCMCQFVINQTSIAIPDAVSGNLDIDDWRISDAGPFGNASKWWMNTSAEGPAKWHNLNSDGWKDGNNIYKMSYSFSASNPNDTKSPYFARLGYHLLCVNAPSLLPENCGCSKVAKVSFGYNATVSAKAVILSGTWNRKSTAIAQDFAVAVVTHEKINALNDVQLLDAGLITARSQCEAGVQPAEIIKDGFGVVMSVVKAVKAVKSGNFDNLSTEVDNLANSLTSLLQKTMQERQCDQSVNTGALLQGGTNITITPNDPVSVVVLSGSELEVSGKRSWRSEAKVLSSYFLTGVLLGSNPDPRTLHCCTDYTAQWSWAGQPVDDSNLRIQVGSFIFSNIPNNVPLNINGVPAQPGQVNITTELGNITADYSGCEQKVPVFNYR